MSISEFPFVWVDTETFGLDSMRDPIIELGIMVTDRNLRIHSKARWLFWSDWSEQRLARLKKAVENGDKNARFVMNMHVKNNLFDEARRDGIEHNEALPKIIEWIASSPPLTNRPMCGSSVQFDREFLRNQMKPVHDLFHYRNIDISTIKELCKVYRPDLLDGIPEAFEEHRVFPDLVDTISEFDYYKTHFLNSKEMSLYE